MPAPTRPPSSDRSRRFLTLTTAICATLLLAAIIALTIWLAQLPEPAPLHSTARLSADSQPAAETRDAAAGARPTARRPATEQREPRGHAVEANAPIIERRWSRTSALSEARPPTRRFDPATLATVAGPQDRSAEARRRRVQQFGGTPATEDAVEAGLAWLAAHQDADGTWNRFEFSRHCPRDDPCPGAAVGRKGYSFRVGLTGLALLAFLGAGYTDREGPYNDVVARAVDALLRAQRADGGFGHDAAMAGYNNALATFALAEYAALTNERRVAGPLERAVTRLVLSQQELGGWDYLADRESGRNDTSITGWTVQALQACVAADIHVPPRVLIKAALHFEQATEPSGHVRYSDAGTGFRIDEETLEPIYRYGPAMVAAALACETLLGWRLESGLQRRQRALLEQELPSVALLQGRDPTQLHSYYYWYYGTVAMFQTGGEQWERWNARLRDAILPLQDRRQRGEGQKYHAFGSWPPFGVRWGKWGRQGGRVYTTALCVLTLEIYYRHTPAYLEDRLPLDVGDWEAFLREASPRQRRQAVEVLAGMRVEVAEPVLVGLLQDRDTSIRLPAAIALVSLDSPLGRPLLERFHQTAPAWQRATLARALRRAREIEALPPARGSVLAVDVERRLATVELPRGHLGMLLSVLRDGQRIAQLRVIRRFTGQSLVLAEFAGQQQTLPEIGDTVISR